MCSYLFIGVILEDLGSGKHLQLVRGLPSPRVFVGCMFRAMGWDVARTGVCEASSPSHTCFARCLL